VEAGLATPSDMYFVAQLQRSAAVTVTAHVCVSHDYPASKPLMALSLLWAGRTHTALNDDAIRVCSRPSVDMKFFFHIHSFDVDIHGYIHIHGCLSLMYACIRELHGGQEFVLISVVPVHICTPSPQGWPPSTPGVDSVFEILSLSNSQENSLCRRVCDLMLTVCLTGRSQLHPGTAARGRETASPETFYD